MATTVALSLRRANADSAIVDSVLPLLASIVGYAEPLFTPDFLQPMQLVNRVGAFVGTTHAINITGVVPATRRASPATVAIAAAALAQKIDRKLHVSCTCLVVHCTATVMLMTVL